MNSRFWSIRHSVHIKRSCCSLPVHPLIKWNFKSNPTRFFAMIFKIWYNLLKLEQNDSNNMYHSVGIKCVAGCNKGVCM